MESFVYKILKSVIVIAILLMMTECNVKTASNLPKDILGVSIGMSKTEVEQHLGEVGQLERIVKKASGSLGAAEKYPL